MSTVYVVQKQLHFDHQIQEMKPRFDLTPAEEYGNIEYLLSPSAAPFKPDSVIADLVEGLRHFTKDDYLLLVGNPILIGLTAAIASEKSDIIQFLQWSGKDQKYISVKADLS